MIAVKRPYLGRIILVTLCLAGLSVLATAQPCTPAPPGLIAWWTGDVDGTDKTGNGYDATLLQDAIAGLPGKVGGAFQFDGDGDIAETTLTIPAQGTIDLWVKPSSLSALHGILGTFGTANGADRIAMAATGPQGWAHHPPNVFVVNVGDSFHDHFIVPSPLSVGSWTHIALTFDYLNEVFALYLDGALIDTVSEIQDPPTRTFSFGGYSSDYGEHFYFPGLIDEVGVFNRVLDGAEIEAIFAAGSAGKCKSYVLIPADIHPKNCPNLLQAGKRGRINISALGTSDLNIAEIDASSVQILGVGATDWVYRDIATPYLPFTGKDLPSDCTTAGRDGYTDLNMKFDNQAVVQAIEADLGRPLEDGEALVIPLDGYLLDGTPIYGEDVVVVSADAGGSGGPVKKENCKNGKDDDGDGLTDCADEDCFESRWCQ